MERVHIGFIHFNQLTIFLLLWTINALGVKFADGGESMFLEHKLIFDDALSVADKCEACPQLCAPDTSECACFRGFLKLAEHHCQDIDECSLERDACGEHGKCINTVGSFVCRCKQGFKPLPSGRCADINECALAVESKPCDQVCTNLPGGFSCSCHIGYQLVTDSGSQGRCEDENECLQETDGCSHLCVNTPGSFVCRCPAPLVLDEDGRTCSGLNAKRHRKSPEPLLVRKPPVRGIFNEDVHRCPHRCLNRGVCRRGACHCPPGLTGNVCQTDVDECSVLPADTRCSHACVNTFGSFRCSCRGGFALGGDGRTCEPLACSPPCMGGGRCQHGRCVCPEGLSGPACATDVDECEKNPCQHICRNTLGSFVCLCKGKWRLGKDGRSCEEPSCTPHCRNGGTCHQGRCVCPTGFHGRLCQLDINECSQAESPCPYACVNMVGSFQCLCPAGLKQSENRTACVVDPLADQHSTDDDSLHVMIEVVVRDDDFSSYTRYFVNPIMATRPISNGAQQSPKSEFPYQPLFEEHHSRNSIQKVEQFSSPEQDRVKTEQQSILPSAVDVEFVVPSTIYFTETPSIVYFNDTEEEEEVSSSIETPILPSEDFSTQIKITTTVAVPATDQLLQSTKITTSGPVHDSKEVVDAVKITTAEPETVATTEEEIQEENTTPLTELKNVTETAVKEKIVDAVTTKSTAPEQVTESEHKVTMTEENTEVSMKITTIATYDETVETTIESRPEEIQMTPSPEVSQIGTEQPQDATTKRPKKLKKKKPPKSKKKTKKKKRPSVGNNLQVLNQILQSFGLEDHQGDAKQFDLIEIDEIPQRLTPPKPQYELPVLKSAPLNVTEERDCYFQRRKIKSRSHFYRDEKNCTKCTCKNGELRCDAHHCPLTKCEEPIQGVCCDYCPGDCVIDNQVYQAGETFVPELDPCRECKCENGRALCSDVECQPLACAPKWRAQLPDDCCPSCVPPGPGCFWNQQFFYVGQLWVQRQGGCQACLCREGGAVQCNPVPCILDCLHPQFVAGECCPVCDNCQYLDKKYPNGETFRNPSDACSTCKCINGNITCFEETCKPNCSHPYKRPGRCCPECTDCFYENDHIREGDTRVFGRDNGTCTECSCKGGEIHCWAAECSSSCELSNGTVVPSGIRFAKPDDHCTSCKCVEGEIRECRNQPCPMECEHGVLLPGACCFHCMMCDYKGVVYKNLQTFKSPDDPCLNCMCALGNVICEENTCLDDSDEDYDQEDSNEDE